jgi:hypothetical protein
MKTVPVKQEERYVTLRTSKNIRFEFETIFECSKIRKTLKFSNFESNIFLNPTPNYQTDLVPDPSPEVCRTVRLSSDNSVYLMRGDCHVRILLRQCVVRVVVGVELLLPTIILEGPCSF